MCFRLALATAAIVALSVRAAPSAARDSFEFLGDDFADGQRWGLEVAFGGGWTGATSDTAYTRTLDDFGYSRGFYTGGLLDSNGGISRFRFSFAVEKIFLRYFSLLLQTNRLDHQEWRRPSGIGEDDLFVWDTWTLDVHARAFIPAGHGRFRGYVQFGVGPTFTPSRLYTRTTSGPAQSRFKELKVTYNVAGLLGAEVMAADHVGFFVQGGYFYAPSLENRFGDRHQSGGGVLLVGISGRFVREEP